jgi:hypothetical protein
MTLSPPGIRRGSSDSFQFANLRFLSGAGKLNKAFWMMHWCPLHSVGLFELERETGGSEEIWQL